MQNSELFQCSISFSNDSELQIDEETNDLTKILINNNNKLFQIKEIVCGYRSYSPKYKN